MNPTSEDSSDSPFVLRYQLIWWSCTSAERRTIHLSLADTTEAYMAVVSPVWVFRLRSFPIKPPIRCVDTPVPDDVAQAQHDFDECRWTSPRLRPYYRKPFAVGACRVCAVKSGQRHSGDFVQVVQFYEREQVCWVHQDLAALCQVQHTPTVPTNKIAMSLTPSCLCSTGNCPLYPSIMRTAFPNSLVIEANLSPSTLSPLVEAAVAAAAAESASETLSPETTAKTPREKDDLNNALFWTPESLNSMERNQAACFFAAERLGFQAGLGNADGTMRDPTFFSAPLMSLYMFDIFRDMSLTVLAELHAQLPEQPTCLFCFQRFQELLGKYASYMRNTTAVKTAFLLGYMVAHLEHQESKPSSVVATANQIRGCVLHFGETLKLTTTPQVTALLDSLMNAPQQNVHSSITSLVRAFRTNQFRYSHSKPPLLSKSF